MTAPIPVAPWRRAPHRGCQTCRDAATTLVFITQIGQEPSEDDIATAFENAPTWTAVFACDGHWLTWVNQMLDELPPQPDYESGEIELGVQALDLRTSWRSLLVSSWQIPLINWRLRRFPSRPPKRSNDPSDQSQ